MTKTQYDFEMVDDTYTIEFCKLNEKHENVDSISTKTFIARELFAAIHEYELIERMEYQDKTVFVALDKYDVETDIIILRNERLNDLKNKRVAKELTEKLLPLLEKINFDEETRNKLAELMKEE